MAQYTQIDLAQLLEQKLKKKPSTILVKFIAWFICVDWMNYIFRVVKMQYNVDFMVAVLKAMKVNVVVEGKENIPAAGSRPMYVSNHPLGGVDVLSAAQAVSSDDNKDLLILANDLLMHLSLIENMLIPVNKIGGQSKNLATKINGAYESNSALMFFPAGKVSRKHNGIIADETWKKTFVSKSIEYKRDIVPIRVVAQNSWFFYALAQFRAKFNIKLNIEMMLLPRELKRQQGKTIKVIIGKPISWQSLQNEKSAHVIANEIKEIVYSL